ncbi:MAG: LemA family protein [Vitreoscilla sp.]|nr:LemA family protein [Burkholderiales bacterium]MBP6337998.1 LemA family protein [Vitreoscilla sp.]
MNFADLSPDTLRWIYRMAAVALLMFWMVGAYNRLMRHRNALATAWGQIDELLARRVAALEPLIAQLHEPMAAEANTLAALQQALERQQLAARVVRAKPSAAAALQAWVVVEGELASPMARLAALVEQHPELAGSEGVKPLRDQLAELAPRLVYARQTFNDVAETYNVAVEEFPTRLLMPLFGFRATAKI